MQNNNSDWRVIGVGSSASAAGATAQLVAPGGTYNYTWSGSCDAAGMQQLYISQAGSEGTLIPTGINGQGSPDTTGTTNSSPPTVSMPTNLPDVGGQSNQIFTATPTTGIPQSNIIWSAGSSANSYAGIEQSIKDAASVAHDDAVKEGNQAHQDSQNIGHAISNITVNASVSNTVSLNLTNYATESTLEAATNLLSKIGTGTNSLNSSNLATENTLKGISNLLANATNNFTDASNAMMSMIPGFATNGAAASSAAHGLLDTPLTGIHDMVTSLTSATFSTGDPGHTSDWNIEMFGHTYDLDPVDMFPNVFAFAFGGWSFILIAIYFFDVCRIYWKCVQAFSTSQLGGVPDLEFVGGGLTIIFGGNFIGVLVAVIVPSIFVGLWILIVTFGSTGMTVWLNTLTSVNNLFTTLFGTRSGTMAGHVMLNAFPIGLSISLIFARLLLQFSLIYAVILASAASRFLFGK